MTSGITRGLSPIANTIDLPRIEGHDSAPQLRSRVSGHASESSALHGSRISLHRLPDSEGVAPRQAAHLDKMEQRTDGTTIKQKFGRLAESFKNGLSLGKLRSSDTTHPTPSLADARAKRQDLRDTLGAVDQSRPSILDKAVDVAGHRGTTIGELINDSRVNQLGGDKRISRNEMNTYIRMGEQIVSAIKNSPDGTAPLTVSVNGETRTVPSNLDTTRAIGWYLHAKAIADNADPERAAATTGKSGAMVASDPGNKIYNFLRSNDGCYGRTSTHLAGQSANSKLQLSWSQAYAKSGIVSAYSIANGKPLQLGIEDFHDKMPGGGGTLLFDSLTPDSRGNERLYMKFEPVGTPNSFGFLGRHMDEADGFAQQIGGFAKVGLRNLDHGLNLVGSIKAKLFSSEEGYRGEKMDKGPTKQLYKDFQADLKASEKWMTSAEREQTQKDVKTFGAAGMMKALGEMIAKAPSGTGVAEHLEARRTALAGMMDRLGADLGMDRTGNEIHVLP